MNYQNNTWIKITLICVAILYLSVLVFIEFSLNKSQPRNKIFKEQIVTTDSSSNINNIKSDEEKTEVLPGQNTEAQPPEQDAMEYADSLPDTSKIKKHKGLEGDPTLWYDVPLKINPIKFYDQKISKLSEFTVWIAGETNKGKRIIVAAHDEGLSGISIDRFIEDDSSDGKMRFERLKYYSEGYLKLNNDVVSVGESYKIIPSLEIPKVLYGPDNQYLEEDIYLSINIKLDKGKNEFVHPENPFIFDDSNLKKAFNHPIYGPVYTSKIIDPGNIFGRGGFYIKLSDGTYKSFSHLIPIEKISWNIGSKTGGHYSSAKALGCSSDRYPELAEESLREKLITAGQMNGRAIYVFKDKKNKLTEDFYREYEKSMQEYAGNKEPIKYDEFVDLHPYFFFEDDFGRLVEGVNSDFVLWGGCGKPVIYLYTQSEMDVSVQIEPTAGRTITIPNYESGWVVRAFPDGTLLNLSDGLKYQYLFWEGHTNAEFPEVKSGFVVNRNDLVNFFDNRLRKVGLNEKEITDFKDFWIKKMQENKSPYFFIRFLFNEYMDEAAPISISPKPDTIIRVFMDWRPLQEPVYIAEQQLITLDRKGFTVVEWGGSLMLSE